MKAQYEAIRSGAIQGNVIRSKRSRTRRSNRKVYVYSGSYGVSTVASHRCNSGLFVSLLCSTKRTIINKTSFLAVPSVRKTVGRTIVLCVAVAVLSNFICAVQGGGVDSDIAALKMQQLKLESENIHLLAKHAVAWGPDNMTKIVEDRLQLYPAEKEQNNVYNHQYAVFR